MTESVPSHPLPHSREVIIVVDDSWDIFNLFQNFLEREGFTVLHAPSAAALAHLLQDQIPALVLLDIGLPDRNGMDILADLVRDHADTAVLMITGHSDLQTALSCLRQGADDYLTKPIRLEELLRTINNSLHKRRLNIENRLYQQQLENSSFRTNLLHQLALKMNSAYLGSSELDDVLQAILVGITAGEGLQFNRAFLALFDEEHHHLQGRLAIGPSSREEAGRVWEEIRVKNLHLSDIIEDSKRSLRDANFEVNRIIRQLSISATASDHTLIRACAERKSTLVQHGQAEDHSPVSPDLLALLQTDSFVIVPLFSPSQSLGVLIADNFITGRAIKREDITDLEIFASQASLAIEHSALYTNELHKRQELEAVTQELEKNKNLLVDAERQAAIGQMAAQLAHTLRNPVASIGGTARLLVRRVDDPAILKLLDRMARDAAKIEATLDEIFDFITEEHAVKTTQPLYSLIRKSILLLYGAMKSQGVRYCLNLVEPGPRLSMDGQKIRQMLLHLLRNAVEAMPNGGTLFVDVRQEVEAVHIIIADSGTGIVNANLAKVADPFFTTKVYGTGMGLALVKKIIAEHQGELSLQAGPVSGTVVTVTLPLAGEHDVNPDSTTT